MIYINDDETNIDVHSSIEILKNSSISIVTIIFIVEQNNFFLKSTDDVGNVFLSLKDNKDKRSVNKP